MIASLRKKKWKKVINPSNFQNTNRAFTVSSGIHDGAVSSLTNLTHCKAKGKEKDKEQ